MEKILARKKINNKWRLEIMYKQDYYLMGRYTLSIYIWKQFDKKTSYADSLEIERSTKDFYIVDPHAFIEEYPLYIQREIQSFVKVNRIRLINPYIELTQHNKKVDEYIEELKEKGEW